MGFAFFILRLKNMSNNSVYTLYSGSDGNSVYFNLAGHEFLIDAGRSARFLCNALKEIGADISKIEAIFITHEHSDHTAALEILEKYNSIPIHIASRSAEKLKSGKNQYLLPNLVTHPPLYTERLGCVKISSFETPHDSRCSVGYRVEFTDGEGEHKIGLATDIGCVTESLRRGLKGCQNVILESNHDVEMLLCGPYPEHLKMRILSERGHLSNVDCAAFAAELAQSGTENFLLAHLSAENNDPSLALSEVQAAVADENITVSVADRYTPTRLI